jgi:HD-GYP domain-containing protein (c-di-GMP phosphodiesterase class II)
MVKKHPGAGYAVAKTFPDTAKIADEILAHAERWDGSGYPRGLRGREIPYLARVFGIIEAFDAMTHARVGRRSCRPPEALERLQAAAGRQFDPELVEVFVGVLVPGEKVTA